MSVAHAKRPAAAIAVVICLVFLGQASAGSLTPPGPPAPTMKPLDQVEPRTPIGPAPVIITQPGSYYLIGNLQGVASQHGIRVRADDVSIDLNGFTLAGVTGSGSGIATDPGIRNLTVRNGIVRDWSGDGISALNVLNVRFEDLVVAGNGFSGANGGSGMFRRVIASRNGQRGIGLDDTAGGTIQECQATDNGATGIVLSYNGILKNNISSHNQGWGFLVVSSVRVEDNHAIGNGDTGFFTSFTGNVFVKNSASTNVNGNYSIPAGNDVGPIGTAAASTSAWANLSN